MGCRDQIVILVLTAVVVKMDAVVAIPPPARGTLSPSYQPIRVTRQLCEDLNPPGYEHPQRTRSPFTVTPEWDAIPDINVYVDSSHSLSYEGLIVQMRSELTGEPIGSMSGYGSGSPIHSVTCVDFEDTAYLASRRWRQSETIYWYAPAGFNRTTHRIKLLATVILGPYVFWQHEVEVPPCMENPYLFDQNEPIVPLKSRKFKPVRFITHNYESY